MHTYTQLVHYACKFEFIHKSDWKIVLLALLIGPIQFLCNIFSYERFVANKSAISPFLGGNYMTSSNGFFCEIP